MECRRNRTEDVVITMKNGLPPSGARTAKTSRGFSRATSRVQTPEQNSETSTGSKFVDNVLGFDKTFSKWVHENCLTDFTYAFLRFFEYSGAKYHKPHHFLASRKLAHYDTAAVGSI